MSRQMFVNLAVKDLKRSVAFFTKLGFEFDARFTDENATCMIISDDCFVMLLVEDFFRGFTTKPIVDASSSTEVIVALSADSQGDVDQLVEAALASGGNRSKEPMSEGGMYSRSFSDPDGHLWEVVYMDPAAMTG
ncbi:VOC family protein [Stackebrandtia soli]|uniref:VOC family protein n=1 Tax=Stackebrandtia soli TaxID=1892856 RepID=UPI0039EAB9D0